MALIWFSCFCWASENLSWIPAVLNESWMSLVLAVRQPLSAPTWAKPTTILSSDLLGAPPLALPIAAGVAAPEQAVSASINALAAKATMVFLITQTSLFASGSGGGYHRTGRPSLAVTSC